MSECKIIPTIAGIKVKEINPKIPTFSFEREDCKDVEIEVLCANQPKKGLFEEMALQCKNSLERITGKPHKLVFARSDGIINTQYKVERGKVKDCKINAVYKYSMALYNNILAKQCRDTLENIKQGLKVRMDYLLFPISYRISKSPSMNEKVSPIIAEK